MNNYRPHLMIFSEDQANIDLANGFLLQDRVRLERIQVLKAAGGWAKVRDNFQDDHLKDLRRWPERRMLLLVDFDQSEGRLQEMKSVVPEEFSNRVFVLGTWTEPEDARRTLGLSPESIGERLGRECSDERLELWEHALFLHNREEIYRMSIALRGLLLSDD